MPLNWYNQSIQSPTFMTITFNSFQNRLPLCRYAPPPPPSRYCQVPRIKETVQKILYYKLPPQSSQNCCQPCCGHCNAVFRYKKLLATGQGSTRFHNQLEKNIKKIYTYRPWILTITSGLSVLRLSRRLWRSGLFTRVFWDRSLLRSCSVVRGCGIVYMYACCKCHFHCWTAKHQRDKHVRMR